VNLFNKFKKLAILIGKGQICPIRQGIPLSTVLSQLPQNLGIASEQKWRLGVDSLRAKLGDFKLLLGFFDLTQVKPGSRQRDGKVNSNSDRQLAAVHAGYGLDGALWATHASLGIDNQGKLVIRGCKSAVCEQLAKRESKI
jgi:hypothetical protein